MKLPPISQLGFVVPDLQLALPSFTALYGEFTRHRYSNTGFWYRGDLCDCVVDVACGASGLHHLQHRAADIEPLVEWLRGRGYECIWRMGRRTSGDVAYMVRDFDPFVIELVEPLARPERL
jgi:hypothetical protein